MAPSTSEEIITCLKSYPSACHKLSIMRNICRLSMSCRRSAQIPMCHLSTRCNTSRPALMKLNRLTSSFNSSEDLQLNLSPAYSTLTWQPWVVWHCWLSVRNDINPVRKPVLVIPRVLLWNKWMRRPRVNWPTQGHLANGCWNDGDDSLCSEAWKWPLKLLCDRQTDTRLTASFPEQPG